MEHSGASSECMEPTTPTTTAREEAQQATTTAREEAQQSTTTAREEAQHWVRGKLLGAGSYGRVNMALDTRTGDLFAVKSVEASPDTAQSRANLAALEGEIRVLSTLDCPYIVRYLGDSWRTEETSGQLARTRNLHLELAPGGSLAGLLKSSGPKGLGLGLVRRYTRDLVHALGYLHSRGLVHGDVKGLNLLIGASCAKLADFGTAFQAGTFSGKVKGLKGSPSWMSPETVKEQGAQGTAVDVWSLGCTVLEMASGRAPWSEVDGGVYGVLYALGCTESLPQIPEDAPEDLRDFVLSCLRREPEDRATAEELLQHPFLREAQGAQGAQGAAAAHAGALAASNACRDMPDNVQSSVRRELQLPLSVDALSAPRASPKSMLGRKRRLSCLSEVSFNSGEEEELFGLPSAEPSPRGSAPCTPREPARKLLRSASSLKSSEVVDCDSATPSFPILDMAALSSRKPWCFGDADAWPQSPLSTTASKWIVVRSPSSRMSNNLH